MIYKHFIFRLLVRKGPGFAYKTFTPTVLTLNDLGINKAKWIDEDGEERLAVVDWDRVVLLQYAGAFDKTGEMIFHGDLLKDNEDVVYEVLSVYGGFAVLDKDQNPVFLSDAFARGCVRIGNVLTDPSIGQPTPEELEKHFAPKKVVRLKKKTV